MIILIKLFKPWNFELIHVTSQRKSDGENFFMLSIGAIQSMELSKISSYFIDHIGKSPCINIGYRVSGPSPLMYTGLNASHFVDRIAQI